MIRIVEDVKDVNIYLGLRDKVGWIKLTKAQAQEALNNSVKVFTVFDDDKPIGMGSVFKNTNVSTTLSVTIFRGTQRITNIDDLHSVYGESAYLQWKSQEHNDDDYFNISSID